MAQYHDYYAKFRGSLLFRWWIWRYIGTMGWLRLFNGCFTQIANIRLSKTKLIMSVIYISCGWDRLRIGWSAGCLYILYMHGVGCQIEPVPPTCSKVSFSSVDRVCSVQLLPHGWKIRNLDFGTSLQITEKVDPNMNLSPQMSLTCLHHYKHWNLIRILRE